MSGQDGLVPSEELQAVTTPTRRWYRSAAPFVWGKARAFLIVLGKKDTWTFLFDATRAVSAAIVGALAIYGVFFTDLPEIIIRQLRADVADAREELVSLRQDRNRANEDLIKLRQDAVQATAQRDAATHQLVQAESRANETRDELVRLTGEAGTLRETLNSAKSELDGVRAETERLRVERQRYERVTRGKELGRITLVALDVAKRYEAAIDAANDYIYAPRMDVIQAELDQKIAQWKKDNWQILGFIGPSASELQARWDRMWKEWSDARSDETLRDMSLRLGEFGRARAGGTWTERATTAFNRHADLKPLSVGQLILDAANEAGKDLTPSDWAALRGRLERAVRTHPSSNLQLIGEPAINRWARAGSNYGTGARSGGTRGGPASGCRDRPRA